MRSSAPTVGRPQRPAPSRPAASANGSSRRRPRVAQRPPPRRDWPPGRRRAPSTHRARRPAAARSAASVAQARPPGRRPAPPPARRAASSMRCSWRSARSGSAEPASAASTSAAAASAGRWASVVPQPEPAGRRAEQPFGRDGVGEPVAGQTARRAWSAGSSAVSRRAGAARGPAPGTGPRPGQLAAGQRGEPGRERMPHLEQVVHDGLDPAHDLVGRRAQLGQHGLVARRPSRRSSPGRTRCGTAGPTRSRRAGTPGGGSGSRRRAARRPAGSSVTSSWCHWITSGSIGSGPNSGSRSAASRLATRWAPISGPAADRRDRAAVGDREQLRPEADAQRRHAARGPPCAAATRARRTTARPAGRRRRR